jgi:hypothetical protein
MNLMLKGKICENPLKVYNGENTSRRSERGRLKIKTLRVRINECSTMIKKTFVIATKHLSWNSPPRIAKHSDKAARQPGNGDSRKARPHPGNGVSSQAMNGILPLILTEREVRYANRSIRKFKNESLAS